MILGVGGTSESSPRTVFQITRFSRSAGARSALLKSISSDAAARSSCVRSGRFVDDGFASLAGLVDGAPPLGSSGLTGSTGFDSLFRSLKIAALGRIALNGLSFFGASSHPPITPLAASYWHIGGRFSRHSIVLIVLTVFWNVWSTIACLIHGLIT